MANSSAQSSDQTIRRVRNRLRAGVAIMLSLLVVVGVKLVLIQGFDAGNLAEAAEKDRTQSMILPAERGQILDSKGAVMATSIIRYDIVIDPQENTSRNSFYRMSEEPTPKQLTIPRDQGLKELATLLDADPAGVKKLATGQSQYALLAKGVKPDVADKIMALRVPGVVAQGVSQRVYPNGSVAGGIIGFLEDGQKGIAGIEQTQDSVLTGTPGERTFQVGADGLIIPVAPARTTPAQNGKSVKLTIDKDLQYFAQQQVQTQVDKLGAEWGSATVVEIKTGNVVAMADSNAPDPNNPGASDAIDLGVRSVTAAVEPGSVQKTFVAAALVETGKSSPGEQFTIGNDYTVNGQTFSDSFTHGTFNRTLAGILGYSLNTGTVMAGERLSRQERYDWFTKFGIGQQPEIPLPGVAKGTLAKPDQWDGRQEFTILFGQGVSQSVLQTTMAYQAIGNNGVMLQPRLIESYIDSDGKETKTPLGASRKVLTPTTAKKTRDMLESVTTAGEWKDAQIPGYRVGAKTGTSESPCDNGKAGFCGYTASIVGMAPMEDPRYVVEVLIQRPKGRIFGIDGADVFRSIMERALRSNNVPPSTTKSVSLDQYGPNGIK